MREVLKNFIVLEGLDGAGTTTQKKAIENELNAMGYKTPVFRRSTMKVPE